MGVDTKQIAMYKTRKNTIINNLDTSADIIAQPQRCTIHDYDMLQQLFGMSVGPKFVDE